MRCDARALLLHAQAAEQQLSLERDPWRVLQLEQQVASGQQPDTAAAAAAAACPAAFVEQELLVEPEPGEDDMDGQGATESEVQR